ncbi:MAG TPA: hypothetical protein DD414_03480 [Lachnospiraceae bacterium]|nr:hypothetical protein [Lachnospiraceae bacterium]
MYKILFVDDEINVLEYLPLAINWEALGITGILTASDAESALQIVKKERPDIAVVDVEMPGKNGLDFCKEAQKIHSQMILVILSAFDRFDYAKRAISIGVNDYLLKPVDEKELQNLMQKIVSGLEKSRKSSLEKKTRQIRAMEKAAGDFLHKLFHNEKPAENLENDFPAFRDYKDVMILMQGNGDFADCREVLEESLDAESLFVSSKNGIYAVLRKSDIRLSAEEKTDRIRWKMEREGFHVWIACVKAKKQETVCQALIRCFYELEKVSFMADKKDRYTEGVGFRQIDIPLPDIQEGLKTLSEDRDISRLRKEICSAMEDAFVQCIEPIRICEMILEVFIALKMYLTKNWQQDAVSILRRLDLVTLMRCGTPENLYGMVDQYLKELAYFVEQQYKTYGDFYIVRIAKEYTKQNYQNKELSLQEVADAVGISRTYFSKMFKETTGEKYWDYLSRCRIEKAKEYLLNTSLGQAQISEKVGYNSEFHFSRKFKELVGVSPNKFRKSR